MSIGPWQIILVLILVVVFFGPGRLPGLGKSLGEAIRGFKKGLSEDEEIDVSKREKISEKEKEKEKENS